MKRYIFWGLIILAGSSCVPFHPKMIFIKSQNEYYPLNKKTARIRIETDKHFSDAIGYDPNYVEAYYNRGLSYELSKDKKKAKADYEKTLQLKEDYEAAVKGLKRVK